MPVVLGIVGVLGFLGWLASEDSVTSAKSSATGKTTDRKQEMDKKVSKIPKEKYCAEAQEILNSF